MLTPNPELVVPQLNANEARCKALFASQLQPSDAPTAEMAAKVIDRTVQQYGIGGCAGRMAQGFGDHPDVAGTGCTGRAGLRPQAASRP